MINASRRRLVAALAAAPVVLGAPALATFTVIAGADKPQHLLDNVKALEIRFTPQDLLEIDRITLVDEDRTVAPVYRTLRPEKIHEFEPMQLARAGAPSRAAH